MAGIRRKLARGPWVYDIGAVKPVYSDRRALVFKWPLTLTLLTFLAALIWGLVVDYRYRSSIIAGPQFDGSIVATVDEYNREVKGDGMRMPSSPGRTANEWARAGPTSDSRRPKRPPISSVWATQAQEKPA